VSLAAGLVPASGSAVLFALASALQHTQVRAVAPRGSLDGRLLYDLARRSRWWLGVLADVGAVGMQVWALHVAPVAFVQGMIVLGLPLAVVLTSAAPLLRPRLVLGTLLTTGGIAVFTAAQPGETPPPRTTWALVVPVAVCLLAALLARRAPTVLVGAAAGVAAGAAAALLAAAAAHPLLSLPRQPEAWLALGAGLLALQLSQSALREASAGAALAALTLAEPVTAVALAALLLRQYPALPVGAVAGALAAAMGVVLLETRSGEDEQRGALA